MFLLFPRSFFILSCCVQLLFSPGQTNKRNKCIHTLCTIQHIKLVVIVSCCRRLLAKQKYSTTGTLKHQCYRINFVSSIFARSIIRLHFVLSFFMIIYFTYSLSLMFVSFINVSTFLHWQFMLSFCSASREKKLSVERNTSNQSVRFDI